MTRHTTIFLIYIAGIIAVIAITPFFYFKFTIHTPAVFGHIKEGLVGQLRTVNPVLAQEGSPDQAISSVVFDALFEIDGVGGIKPVLARGYEISPDGQTYTIVLKDNVYWHDKTKITTDDIVFTLETIQNPAYQSPQRINWQGVVAEKINDNTVKFELSAPYEPFLQSLTNLRIIPKHVWQNIKPENFSLAEANLKSIGSGPYKFKELKKDKSGNVLIYTLTRSRNYLHGQGPYIKSIDFRFYPDSSSGYDALIKKEINNFAGLTTQEADLFRKHTKAGLYEITIPRYFAVFFNQKKSNLLSDSAVRQAIYLATDKERIVKEAMAGFASVLNGPIDNMIFGYSAELPSVSFSIEEAKNALKESGWTDANNDGVLAKKIGKSKNETELKIILTILDINEVKKVADILSENWSAAGIKTEIDVKNLSDIQNQSIKNRDYEAILFGEIYGQNPDLFDFWHINRLVYPGLNLSGYQNPKLNELLEEARKTADLDKKKADLIQIQEILLKDKPALFLYNPYYLYVADANIKGFETKIINNPAERFSQIESWYIKTKRSWKIL